MKHEANLTNDRAVDSLKWREGDPAQFLVKSTDHPGFYIRVSKGGTKAWLYRYTFEGKMQRFPLGRYPGVTCAEAFTAYKDAREEMRAGVDPLAKRRAEEAADRQEKERETFTLTVLFDEHYWPRFAKKKRTSQNDRHYFDKKIKPVLGHKSVSAITPEDVERLIRPLERKGYSTGRLTLAVLRKMYNWAALPESAVTEGGGSLLDATIANPCRLYRLSDQNKPAPVTRFLQTEEIKKLWHAVGDSNSGRILKLQLLTGCRVSEVCGMHESEIDRGASNIWGAVGEWGIPGARNKTKRAHLVPITPKMLELIGAEKEGFIFPADSKTGHTMSSGPTQCLKRHCDTLEIKGVTTHTMRYTFITNMARLGVRTEIRNRLTNHKDPSIDRQYNQHDYPQEKTEALIKWGELVETIVNPPDKSNVTEIDTARKEKAK